jgi:hypothetical protein
VFNLTQPEFPPPEADGAEQSPAYPAQMDYGQAVAARILHEAREAPDQPRDAQTQNHADQDADMQIEVNIH